MKHVVLNIVYEACRVHVGVYQEVREIVPAFSLWRFVEMIVYYYFYSLLTYLLFILCC